MLILSVVLFWVVVIGGAYVYGVRVGIKSQREAVEVAYERGRDDAIAAVNSW